MTDNTQLPITAIVSTKNEERAIRTCLEALKPFSQVIVVDSSSSDRTPEIVTSLGHELVQFVWNGSYPKKKQWCLDNLQFRNEWVMFIDADERPTVELLTEIQQVFDSDTIDSISAFDIPLRYIFAGRTLRHGHTVVKRALVRVGAVTFPVIHDLDAPGMGELEGHYQPTTQGRVGRMQKKILHDDPDPVSTWIRRHNGYSDWEAFLRTNPQTAKSVRALRSRQGRLFDRLPGKPVAFFLYSYLARFGFLDGRAGFDYAIALSFYYWLINLKVAEARRNAPQK